MFADQPSVIRTVGSPAASIGLCLLVIGMLAPRVVPRLDSWVTAAREMGQLGPLWSDLTAAVPSVVLPTRLPWTRHRAELRCDRRFVEVAEALTYIRVREDDNVHAGTGHTVAELAHAVRASRLSWITSDGVPAASLLPQATAANDERAHLLMLAREYRAANGDSPAFAGARA